jgi:hypothetical protein
MRSVLTLLLAFILSAFVGTMVQTQLAVAFNAGVEFAAVLMLFLISAVVAIIVFAIALAAARRAGIIDWVALALLVVTALMVAAFAVIGAGGRAIAMSRDDLPILAEIVVPTAIMIGIQWWMVRRRWRRVRAAAVPT